MSMHKLVATITLYNLEQVAALVTSLGLLEDAPVAEISYEPDRNLWRAHLYAD